MTSEDLAHDTAEPWIDTHVHAWNNIHSPRQWLVARPELPAIVAPPTASELHGARSLGIVLVEAGVEAGHQQRELEWLSRVAENQPGILGVIASADWREPQSIETFTARDSRWLVGVRVNLGGAVGSAREAATLADFLTIAREVGLSVDILCSAEDLPMLGAALARATHGKVILDHFGAPPVSAAWGSSAARKWAESVRGIADAGAFTKISGFAALGSGFDAVMPFVECALAAFGSTRSMLGSDWPVSKSGNNYGDWIRHFLSAMGPLDSDLREATARRTYGLAPTESDRI